MKYYICMYNNFNYIYPCIFISKYSKDKIISSLMWREFNFKKLSKESLSQKFYLLLLFKVFFFNVNILNFESNSLTLWRIMQLLLKHLQIQYIII